MSRLWSVDRFRLAQAGSRTRRPALPRARRSIFSPRKMVCDVPSGMSSNRIVLLRKRTPLFVAAIGASSIIVRAHIVGHGDASRPSIRAGIGRAEEAANQGRPGREVLRFVKRPTLEIEVDCRCSLFAVRQDLDQPAEVISLGLIHIGPGRYHARGEHLVRRFVVLDGDPSCIILFRHWARRAASRRPAPPAREARSRPR